MSPRNKVPRKILDPPIIKGFKPYGQEAGGQKKEAVNLLYEEYEAIRLSDYNSLNHHQASVTMGVSRPTFTRIYASALQKIAKAFVEGRQISIEGGKVYYDSNWYHCKSCKCNFNNPRKETQVANCPLCGSKNVKEFKDEIYTLPGAALEREDLCVCPNCGYQQDHQPGRSCNQTICPECSSLMRRKRKIKSSRK